jgi:hypothetical protein
MHDHWQTHHTQLRSVYPSTRTGRGGAAAVRGEAER